MSIDAIRDELVSRLQTVTVAGYGTLKASKYFADSIVAPCAVVAEQDPFIVYDETLDGTAAYQFRIVVYATRASEDSGQAVLDGLRDPSGAGSVHAAINASWVGESAAYYATCSQCGPVQQYTVGTIDYLGAEFLVLVVAN